MASIDRGDVQATTASVQLALSSLEQVKGSGEVQQEQQLLGELLELISGEKLAIARKVMGTQAYMRARGRKVRDQEGRSDG